MKESPMPRELEAFEPPIENKENIVRNFRNDEKENLREIEVLSQEVRTAKKALMELRSRNASNLKKVAELEDIADNAKRSLKKEREKTRELKEANAELEAELNADAADARVPEDNSILSKGVAAWVRQAVCIPIPINSTSGIIGIANAISKYGGPTEILPSPRASSTSG